jgi:hypothetical protein
MANMIISCIPFVKYEQNKEYLFKKFSGKHTTVEILGVDLHTSFNREDLELYYDKWYLKKSDFVSEKESA